MVHVGTVRYDLHAVLNQTAALALHTDTKWYMTVELHQLDDLHLWRVKTFMIYCPALTNELRKEMVKRTEQNNRTKCT